MKNLAQQHIISCFSYNISLFFFYCRVSVQTTPAKHRIATRIIEIHLHLERERILQRLDG